MATYVSAIHNHSIAGGTDNSEDAELPSGCPGWEANPHFTGFESARSASWRTGALLALWDQQDDNLPDHGTLVGMSQNPLRVVIAEDEALIRLDLKEMLEEEGYSVVAEAGDGESAVEHVTTLRPDLAILDIKMPVLDGISAAERIAAERIAPVVILTALFQRALVVRARDAGALAYLVKPVTKAHLVPALA